MFSNNKSDKVKRNYGLKDYCEKKIVVSKTETLLTVIKEKLRIH